MTETRRKFLAASAVLSGAGLWSSAARAQAAPVLRLGILGDLSGPYRDLSGLGTMACVRQAVGDFASAGAPLQVEVLHADHQHKADVGAAIARQWYDREGVDAILEVNNSSIALALAGLVQEKNKVQMNSGALSAAITGERCSANTIHWTADTWMLANSVGQATVKAGGDSWFLITADYAFGHQMERDLTRFVGTAGGRIVGGTRFPFPGTADFSSFLLQAQSSRAKVVGLLMAGGDMINCIKQAREFGVTRRARLVGIPMFVTDIHSMGLEVAQGLTVCETFYWDMNDRTRAFLDRVKPKTPSNYPNQEHAGTYSGALHYLKAVADLGAERARASGLEVVQRMKAMPTDDDCFGPGRVREDGRKIHPAYLFEVKSPAESKGPWDYYKLAGTVPAEQAFRPIAEGNCPLVKG